MFVAAGAVLAVRYRYLAHDLRPEQRSIDVARSARGSGSIPSNPFAEVEPGKQQARLQSETVKKAANQVAISGPRFQGASSPQYSVRLHPDDDATPKAVVGRPFPVSASIDIHSKVHPAPEVAEVLNKFAQEPRDVSWAHIEARIEGLFPTADGVAARTIECRTSICVYEVTSTSPSDFWYLSDRYLVDQVTGVGELDGYERDATNQQIKVLLEVLVRNK
jgi:hypothetical protein